MGLSISKRVKNSLQNSPEFNAACDDVYDDCISVAQHAFPGIKPYQLFSAVEHLHRTLHETLRLVSKWVPHPPDRSRVDRALKAVLTRRSVREEEITLGPSEFKELAAVVFADAVVSSAGGEVLKKVPLGAVGIAGIGAVVKPGKEVLAVAIGAYALGVATSVFLSLNGGLVKCWFEGFS